MIDSNRSARIYAKKHFTSDYLLRYLKMEQIKRKNFLFILLAFLGLSTAICTTYTQTVKAGFISTSKGLLWDPTTGVKMPTLPNPLKGKWYYTTGDYKTYPPVSFKKNFTVLSSERDAIKHNWNIINPKWKKLGENKYRLTTVERVGKKVLLTTGNYYLVNNVTYKGKKYHIIIHYAKELKPKTKCRNVYDVYFNHRISRENVEELLNKCNISPKMVKTILESGYLQK